MALDFVQLEFFVYGLLVTAWTGDPGWGFAVPMLFWFGLVWPAIHREDVDELQFEFHAYTIITMAPRICISTRMLRLIATNIPTLRSFR